MGDQWGPIQIPLVEGEAGDAVGDPALTTLLAFLQAFLNANTSKVWNAIGVSPNQPCVKTTRAWNPSDTHGDHRGVGFNTADLPALYAFRNGGKFERIAEDWLEDESELKLLWVFPIAMQATQRVRQSFANVVAKFIVRAIEKGRTPTWIVKGDKDPRASDEGSSLYTHLDAVRIRLDRWAPARVQVEGDTQKLSYASAEFTLTLEETFEESLDGFAETTSVRQQISNEQSDLTEDALFESPDPSNNEGD